MVYHRALLNPTEGQVSDLMKGVEVKLGPDNISGDVAFKLNTAQMKRLAAAAEKGRGCTLKFTAAQVKHMAMNGEGVIGDLAKVAFNVLKPALRNGLNKGITYVRGKAQNKINDGLDWVQDKTQDKLEGALRLKGDGFGSFFKGVLKKGAHGLVDVAADALGGTAGKRGGALLNKPSRYRGGPARPPQLGSGCKCEKCGVEQSGSGWFSSLLKGVAHGAINVIGGSVKMGPGAKCICESCGHSQKGAGWFSNLLKTVAHGAVDVIGGSVNPHANVNEQIYAALNQKKVAAGSGLRLN